MTDASPDGSNDSDRPWIECFVEEHAAGQRLDAYLTARFGEFSRVQWRRAINAGEVRLDRRLAKASAKLVPQQRIALRFPEQPAVGPEPEEIPLAVLYEDEFLVAIDKPPGMVVHPARGHWRGTLASALAFHFDQLSDAGGPTRPGIVHRLDRDTSGVILVAKTNAVHMALSRQFEQRETEKEYYALAWGKLDRDRDWIRAEIGPHPHHREKMAIRANHPQSRAAETFFEVAARRGPALALHVFPRTGRTHQIRVHLAHLGCPVLCDPLYSGRSVLAPSDLAAVRPTEASNEPILSRCGLHARRITFSHPAGGRLTIEAPLPDDLVAAWRRLSELLPE